MTTDAVSVMSDPELQLTISCDGLPEIHDRHRRTADGAATSPVVVQTIQQLLQRGLAFHVNMVVRPDNISSLCSGVEYIRNLGVTHIDLALDLWTNWAQTDRLNLQKAIEKLAALWLEGLPTCGINWYDEQALKLSRIDVGQTARCGFGAGEIAVAPSGRMYPCERLMGEDAVDQPMRLAGHVSQGVDFLSVAEQPQRNDPSCDECAIHTACSTNCRCSNYVRTGDVSQPDRLLCDLNAACAAAIAARFWQPVSLTVSHQPEYAL